MSFDNRVFNINGEDKINLKKTIDLAFSLYDNINTKANFFTVDPVKGLILFSYDSTSNNSLQKFPISLDSDSAFEFVVDWLKSESAANIELEGFFSLTGDSDVFEDFGWRVYLDDWGHIDKYSGGVICGITPSWIWYGK